MEFFIVEYFDDILLDRCLNLEVPQYPKLIQVYPNMCREKIGGKYFANNDYA
jgi:hypothetical protein